MIEHPVEREVLLVERRVLAMHVADPVADAFGDQVPVHPHPEEVARIEVGRQGRPERDELLEGGDVVHGGSRVKFDADQQVRVLGAGEGGEVRPVRRDDVGPLTVVDPFEIRQPASGTEVRGVVCRAAARASGHRHHPVGSQCRWPAEWPGEEHDRAAGRGRDRGAHGLPHALSASRPMS